MIKFETVKAGDVLYDVRSDRTAMRSLSWWSVCVFKVDPTGAWSSWNGNPVEHHSKYYYQGLRRSVPKKLACGGSTKPSGATFEVPPGWKPPKVKP